MKKIKIVSFCLVFAIAFSAYVSYTKTEVKQTRYIWFLLKPGISIACENYTTVTSADLILFERKFGISTPVDDMIDYHLSIADAVDFILCPTTETYVCAVGYAAVDSNFEAVTIGGVVYWRPKSTVNELVKLCKPNT